ncbi:bifunctional phosphoribosylaminoimidazolecarboxamide formyltransferase/IMP cyclohydrolase [Alicyclobacillus curvatus]|nr:bifunctional phosphoribosylaminoimidazolecarboxamide formyltransferase/IMP cyclohydrolase [Alicyclobacillus curvatus]
MEGSARLQRRFALISVFDKSGIVDFTRDLVAAGYGILSTGGTARTLIEAGIDVTPVEDYTGFPEMMDGRVKTLHPRIHGGLLALRDDDTHMQSLREHDIDMIDVVVVNLYPFEQTIAKPNVSFEEAVEMIDIGGPSMLRAAAKNHPFVIPVIDSADYAWIGERLRSGGQLSSEERRALAAKVFRTTGSYDRAIDDYFQTQLQTSPADTSYDTDHGQNAHTPATDVVTEESESTSWPSLYTVTFEHKQGLRYGENPHQSAHFYAEPSAGPATIAAAIQLQGKELSYNNIQDADAALRILRDLDDLNSPAVVAVKHMNPCGVGIGSSILEAFVRAYEADSVSIFGGIIACNRAVDEDLAERLTDMFLEIVIAPEFTAAARERFARKKNVRLLTVDMVQPLWKMGDHSFRRVSGGLLVQEIDLEGNTPEWTVVTKRQPTQEESIALQFAWKIVKHVKSNAIVLATHASTVGIGAGQMNRVGAAEIAIRQAGPKAKGSVLASDAFFPMRDTVDTAAAAGVRAIIQPGGSVKDQESIAAADENDIAMVVTGTRHFLH